MARQKKLEVRLDDVTKKFKDHISQKHNTNILFSGKFGTGKSTFLAEFFKRYDKTYFPITLRPVNYVVSSNENIFELIKIDIIKQLFEKGVLDFDAKSEANKLQTVAKYVKNRPFSMVTHLSSMLSKLHPVLEVASVGAKGIHALLNDFAEFEDELRKSDQSSDEVLKDHILDQENLRGTYLEFDLITQLIKESIDDLKTGDNILKRKLKPVLIIDDLDRLDPDHIFRILNILSSHNDHYSSSHKFNFDKVILVCDIDNIQSVFEHRYGKKADFEGYMDKFYSEEIFAFSNIESIKYYAQTRITFSLDEASELFFIELICLFIEFEILSLRNLIKYKNQIKPHYFEICRVKFSDENVRTKPGYLKGVSEIIAYSTSFDILTSIVILSKVFGSLNSFQKSLGFIKTRTSNRFIEDQRMLHPVLFAHHFLSTRDNDSSFFFSLVQRGEGKYITHSFARNSWQNIVYEIGHNWRETNPYEEYLDYYSEHKIIVENNIKISWDKCLTIMEQTINYILHKGWPGELNIFSK